MTLFPIATIAALIFLLAALIAMTVSAVVLYRLRRDRQWAEAAERHVRVDLQYLMKKHVPLHRMTGMPTTELPIAKQNIARLLRRWKRIIAASTALCIVGVILVTVGSVTLLGACGAGAGVHYPRASASDACGGGG